MNEVTKIHLGRQAFTISVAAHKSLRSYLDAIEKQVADKDVVEEVELRMAELLTEHGVLGDKVILVKDVDFLKGQLGDPADFKEDDSKDSRPGNLSEGKRLFRDTDNAMIAGVASGLSAYFGVDVLLVRVLFVVGTIAWGGGILLYIMLWLLVPEARTPSERLLMAGRAVTVESLKEIVERADIKAAARRANDTVVGPINAFFELALKVIGIVFVLAGLAALFGLIAAETYLLLNNASFVQDNIFPVGFREHLLLDIAVTVIGLISIFIILFGMAIFRRKWPIRNWITGMLIGLILIGIASGGALAADVVPNVRDRYNINVHTSIRDLQPFTYVNVIGNNAPVQVQTSSNYSVSLKYYGKADLSTIKTAVSNGVLTIDTQQFNWRRHCTTLCLPATSQMVITVSAPSLPQIKFPYHPDKAVFPGMVPVYQ